MTAVLQIDALELDARFFEQLKTDYPEGSFEIRVREAMPSNAMETFSEKQFWAVIDKLDWTATGDDAAVLEPAIQFLSDFPVLFIHRFLDLLAEKLRQLDTINHSKVFLKTDEDYLSVDDFLYARCCVVANGYDVYKEILTNPAKMPTDVTFEPLLHLANRAYERKTGKKSMLFPVERYETYANKAGWLKSS